MTFDGGVNHLCLPIALNNSEILGKKTLIIPLTKNQTTDGIVGIWSPHFVRCLRGPYLVFRLCVPCGHSVYVYLTVCCELSSADAPSIARLHLAASSSTSTVALPAKQRILLHVMLANVGLADQYTTNTGAQILRKCTFEITLQPRSV